MRPVLYIATAIAILFGATSCSREPRPEPGPATHVTRISNAPDEYQLFEYNAAGQLRLYTAQWKNGDGTSNVVNVSNEYSGNSITRSTTRAGHTLLTYEGNLPVKGENFLRSGKLLSVFFYHFNPQHKLEYVTEKMAGPLPDDAAETRVSYQYNAAGNVSRMDFAYRKDSSAPFIVTQSKEFATYDTGKNAVPEEVLGTFLTGVSLFLNNPTRVNNYDGNGSLTGYQRFEYVYNEAGYPVQKKLYVSDGTSENEPITFQFTY